MKVLLSALLENYVSCNKLVTAAAGVTAAMVAAVKATIETSAAVEAVARGGITLWGNGGGGGLILEQGRELTKPPRPAMSRGEIDLWCREIYDNNSILLKYYDEILQCRILLQYSAQ